MYLSTYFYFPSRTSPAVCGISVITINMHIGLMLQSCVPQVDEWLGLRCFVRVSHRHDIYSQAYAHVHTWAFLVFFR